MGKVVIDYEGFKDVLRDYLAENLINEIISCMNDNLVFIEDINEETESVDKKVSTVAMTTEETIREVKAYKTEKPLILSDEMISAMRDTRAAIKEIKHYKNNSSVRV